MDLNDFNAMFKTLIPSLDKRKGKEEYKKEGKS